MIDHFLKMSKESDFFYLISFLIYSHIHFYYFFQLVRVNFQSGSLLSTKEQKFSCYQDFETANLS